MQLRSPRSSRTNPPLPYTTLVRSPPEDWEPRAQLLFRATRFGDEVDRPLRKSDGAWTYFAADIAYHYDKFRRGFTAMRSEEHTSELQSLMRISYAVFCLKKKIITSANRHHIASHKHILPITQ